MVKLWDKNKVKNKQFSASASSMLGQIFILEFLASVTFALVPWYLSFV